MSTKIWTAYKLKDRRIFWDFIRDIRKQAITVIEKNLLELEKHLMNDVDTNSKEFKQKVEVYSNTKDPTLAAKQSIVGKFMRDGYKEASKSPYREYLNFDVSISFREYKKNIYMIPYCDMTMRDVLNFLRDDIRVEDFHYQNQTDRPEDIPAREWNRRGKIWDAMYDDGWDNFLLLNIMSYDKYYMHSPDGQRVSKQLKKTKIKD